jgi:(p)ppGpp synthase/HD superfamily hydrolase
MPYITHPIRVADQLKHAGASKELICAGYLHDTVEDTPVSLEDIKKTFGVKIANLVAAHTEDKSKSWKERKQRTIDTLTIADPELKYLIVADKLDNLLSLEKDLQVYGKEVWKNFNAGPDQQKWYYESIAQKMYAGLSEKDIPHFFKEYEEAVQRFFG